MLALSEPKFNDFILINDQIQNKEKVAFADVQFNIPPPPQIIKNLSEKYPPLNLKKATIIY